MMTSGSTDLDAARERLATIDMPATLIDALCAAAQALGVPSLRAPLQALAAARASAALDGNDLCTEDDARIAASLVLAPRATQLPPSGETAAEESDPLQSDDVSAAPPEPPEPAPPEPPSPPSAEHETSDTTDIPAHAGSVQAMEDRVLDAAQAAIPPGLLAALLGASAPRRSAAGKSGATAQSGLRGRPTGSRRSTALRGARLHLVDTLRAAAPWQRLRRGSQPLPDLGPGPGPSRVLVRADDFHVIRVRQKSATTTVFLVDASGSSAMHRLAEAKGAVELLLNDCYVRRDQVAVIAFRGRQAELLLPPTRSLVCAKRRLSGLPGGGGTPLASALDAAASLVDALQRKGQSPTVVLLTDGRANVARDGSGGRERAQDDALHAGRQLAALGAPIVMIDTSPKAQREAAELARTMRANYLPLPYAGANELARSIAVAQASMGAH